MIDRPDIRHLEPASLSEYLAAGAPALVPIDGSPSVVLVIEPGDERLAIRAPYDGGDLPDLARYRHLDLDVGTDGGEDWVEFSVSGGANLLEAYPVLRSVADRVQLDGYNVGAAVIEVLGIYHQMLSALGRLTDEQEIGLAGELLVLTQLIRNIGSDAALVAWRGPASEEHDFGLAEIDVEVKTTLSEQRAHRISSVTQLEPNPQRELWLASVQLTTGGQSGRTLPQMIDALWTSLSTAASRSRFTATLDALGWTASQSELYTRSFSRRGTILTFMVGPEFPAITQARLAQGGVPIERIRSLSYILSLVGLSGDEPPPALAGIGDDR